MFDKSKVKPHDFEFNLGDKLKDELTGFEGVCVYRTQWLTNCNVYGLKPDTLDKDGNPRDSKQFDEPHLSVAVVEAHEPSRFTGGPTDAPSAPNRM